VINVGLVGYGYWGRVAARAIARTARLSVVVDIDPRAGAQADEDWADWGVATMETLQQAADDLDLEAVWVCTPTADHYRTVKEALALGLHVLCEKPFVTSVAQAQELVMMSQETDSALMVGHLVLHTRLHDIISTWGRPRTIAAVRRNTEASLADGSVLFGIGPHEISPIVDLYGEPDWVECEGTEHRVEYELRWHEPSMIATGELDWLAENRVRWLKVDNRDINPESAVFDGVEPTVREMRAFLAAIRGEDRQRWRADALSTTAVLERLEQARLAP
jgi:predicted dehydrogenase